MKRFVLALAAIATVAGPLAVATEANAQPRRDRYERQWDRRDYDRRDYGRRDYGRRDYSYRYAPPPRVYYGYPPPRYGYAPGYVWRRGAYLPPSYGGVYISNYRAYGLRAPPRGYRWRRVGDDYLLTAIATGLIFDIVTR
jgi:Ni/Co efflux regulator RcnB